MSISRLWHINISIVVQDITIGELIEGYMGSLCIICINCICIYSYLKIRSTKQNLPTKKTPSSDGFNDEIYQTFKEKVTLSLHKLFRKKEHFQLIYEASIIQTPKTDKNITRKL